MSINIRQLDMFCASWLRKARSYERPFPKRLIREERRTAGANHSEEADAISRSFDRFTSLFVVFNRIYTEAGKLLIRRGQVQPNPRKPYAPLADRISATSHILTFYGEAGLRDEISANDKCRAAVDNFVRLIREGRFYLHENYVTGVPDVAEDMRLADEAGAYRPRAILSLIYQARCNSVHGEKDFDEGQRELLDSMSVTLEFVVRKTLARLKEELANP